MKKLLILLAFSAVLSISALAQSNAPLTVQEIDGSPRGTNISVIKVSNGSLTISGHTATIVTGGGGGGGCTPPGTASRVLYDDGAGGCTSTSGLTATATIATMTNGRFVTAINDSAGNELIKLTATGSAVNEITLANAATGNNPTITASGGDSDVGFNFLVKGAGVYNLLASTSGPTDLRLYEDADNGSNYVSLLAAASLAGNVTITFPSSLPAGTECLQISSAGVISATGSGCGGSGGITVGTTTVTSGTATRLFYETAGNVVGEISGATSDGTTVTLTSPTVNTGITLNAAPLTMSGNISAAAWTTSGIRFKGAPVTLTDTSSSGTVAAAYTNVLGGNTIAASSSTTFTDYFNTFIAPPTAGSNVTITNGWSLGLSGGQRINRDGIGTTNTTGLELANATAAAAGAQQVSPDLVFTAQGWKTTATAASQTVNWRAFALPVQGTTAPTANWVLQSQINGGGYTTRLNVTSAGDLTAARLLSSGNGTETSPFIAGNAGRGFYEGIGGLVMTSGSVAQVLLGGGTYGLLVNGNSQIAFNQGGSLQTSQAGDTIIRRAAAANLAFGAADAASPVAQTLSVQNVVGGTTDTAGVTTTIKGSLGTSQGVPGRVHVQGGAMITASGSTQQTAIDRNIFGATKVLTNNSAITIVNVTDASNTSTGGVLDYCVEVFDGTDTQYECGMATYGVSNKAGAFSGNTVTKFGNHQNATAGTLAVTIAISAANPGALSVNANSSLTPSTGYPRIVYSLRNLGNQAVAVQ